MLENQQSLGKYRIRINPHGEHKKAPALITEVCKIIQACLNFRGTVAANWLLSATACQAAIFGKIGKKNDQLSWNNFTPLCM